MSSQTDEINHLIRSAATHTTDEFETTNQQAGGFIRYVDVTIIDVPQESEAPPIVESDLTDDVEEASQEEPKSTRPTPTQEAEPAPQTRLKRTRSTSHTRRPVAVILACACIFLLAGIVTVVVLPLLAPSVAITLTPKATQIQIKATLHIPGHALADVTMKASQSAATTGTHHQVAQAGHGTVIFYNAAPYAQSIAAGTLLTGADGVQIVTDQDAMIPAVSYPTLGQASVPAHSVIVGPASNIAAGDIYGPCCRLNVSAVNVAFRGGQEARSYQTPTQQDIDRLKASMQESIDQSIEAALQAQTQHIETLMKPYTCHSQVTTDHQPGEEAAAITVHLEQTCSATVYNTVAYQSAITEQSNQQAIKQLGDGYSLTKPIQSAITKSSSKQSNIDLEVSITASYAYQFSQEQQQRMKALIAGKSQEQATTALLQVPGVQNVSFSEKDHSNTLPTDSTHIQFTFLLTGWSE